MFFMKKNVFVSFTLKPLHGNRNFSNSILPVLERVASENPGSCLNHGFLPREVVVEKGFGTEVVDALDRLWPDQRNWFDPESGKPRREDMAQAAKDFKEAGNGVEVIIIGPPIEGVLDEFKLYDAQGFTVNILGWEPLEQ